jgi:rubrerythrin
LTRERVIVDVEDLEQAAKIEETVYTGYCEAIKDSLVHWIAVEEDIIESYRRLSKRIEPKISGRLEDLAAESTNNLTTLREILKSLEVLGQQRKSRMMMLRDIHTASS